MANIRPYIDEEPYYGSAASLIPKEPNLQNVKEAAMGCKACHLWRNASQTVFGEGLTTAKLMLIGEQPGDREDLEGHPFVGPAGQLLNSALQEAGINREDVYITNAVKHFKWVPQGPRRLHQKPNRAEVKSCLPWLETEIKLVAPKAIVLLGATAAQALLGSAFRLTQHRGEFTKAAFAEFVLATLHPSAILRAPDAEAREQSRISLVEDLKLVGLQLR